MTAIAITVLAVWAVGIVINIAVFPHLLRSNPMARLAFDLNPAATCLLTAIAVAFWPGALTAAGLNHLANRRNR